MRSPRTPLLLLGLVISIASVGCHTRYSIRIAAISDPERISVFEPGASIAVTFDPDAQPLSLYQDLALTIERQLQEMGFTVADERDAKIFVLFGFGTDITPKLRRIGSAAIQEMDLGKIQLPQERTGTAYSHRCRVVALVSDAQDKGPTVVWAGEARLHESTQPNPGRSDEHAISILNQLCKLATEPFGEDRKPRVIDYFDSYTDSADTD